MKADIKKIIWQQEEAVFLEAGGYEALVIPGIGANLIQLKDTIRGLDLLRTPESISELRTHPQNYGIPILFPPNRIEDGTFKVGNTVYNFPINSAHNNHIHGFLHTRPWKVTRMEVINISAVEVELSFKVNKDTDFYKYFPHEFECKILYRLSKDGLEQKISIKNESNSLMPIGLGFHTTFNIPFDSEDSADEYRVKVSIGERWELNERSLPTGNKISLSPKEIECRENGMKPLGEAYDKHFNVRALDIDGEKFHGGMIENISKQIKLVYEVGEEYKHWMLWNKNGQDGFVCLEPQTWMINAPNVKLEDEVTGFKLIKKGETWEGKCKIFIEQ